MFISVCDAWFFYFNLSCSLLIYLIILFALFWYFLVFILILPVTWISNLLLEPLKAHLIQSVKHTPDKEWDRWEHSMGFEGNMARYEMLVCRQHFHT